MRYDDCGRLARMATSDALRKMNPVETDESKIRRLYEAAFSGELKL